MYLMFDIIVSSINRPVKPSICFLKGHQSVFILLFLSPFSPKKEEVEEGENGFIP